MRSIRRSRATLSRSAAIVSAIPGYCTFTATARPSCVIARCTWPIDAAAMGSGSQRAKARSGGGAELLPQHGRGQLRAHRRDAVLQAAERAADRGRQAVVHVARHLADLHQHALHRPEGGRDVLGGLQGQVVAQLLPVLAGRREQPRRAAGVAQPAAYREPDRRQPAAAAAGRPGARRSRADGISRRRPGRRRASTAAAIAPIVSPAATFAARAAGLPHARRAARIRRVIRCRASSTPGSPRYTASSTPSACRISVCRAGVSGGGLVAVHLPRPVRQRGDHPVADVRPDLRHVLVQARAGRAGRPSTRWPPGCSAAPAAPTRCSAAAGQRVAGTSAAGTPTSSAATTISAT